MGLKQLAPPIFFYFFRVVGLGPVKVNLNFKAI